MFNNTSKRNNKPIVTYTTKYLKKRAGSPNKENLKNKENQINPKNNFKSSSKPNEPINEISRFGIKKENRSETYLKKNLVKGNFFDDNKYYLTPSNGVIEFNISLEDEPDNQNYLSIKSSYSSFNNINSNYFLRK